jgi:carboxypeptidase C (cathepsin A)
MVCIPCLFNQLLDILSHQANEISFFNTIEPIDELAQINLKSILIGYSPFWIASHVFSGNGLTDGKTQYSQYANMACNNSYGPVLSSSECAQMEAAYPRCAQLIQSCYDNQLFVPLDICSLSQECMVLRPGEPLLQCNEYP